jgi:hypothetical protein
MSQLSLVGADMALAEAALKTMLRTHELMVQDKESIECRLGLAVPASTNRAQLNDDRKLDPPDVTSILSRSRLRPGH